MNMLFSKITIVTATLFCAELHAETQTFDGGVVEANTMVAMSDDDLRDTQGQYKIPNIPNVLNRAQNAFTAGIYLGQPVQLAKCVGSLGQRCNVQSPSQVVQFYRNYDYRGVYQYYRNGGR